MKGGISYGDNLYSIWIDILIRCGRGRTCDQVYLQSPQSGRVYYVLQCRQYGDAYARNELGRL
nr:MAG TPA: hypothetical protein [Caudoviricetes sp.]